MRVYWVADEIMLAGQLAAALEVSGYPKPGNVHRTSDLHNVRYEHFIAGSVSLGPALREATLRGALAAMGKMDLSNVEIGSLILRAVSLMRKWHRGGNTHLGVILLFIPMSAAAAMSIIEQELFTMKNFRSCFSRLMRASTIKDAVNACEAIILAEPGGLGEISNAPDLSKPDFKEKIVKGNYTLWTIMQVSSRWDNIAKELVTELKITLTEGYPELIKVYEETRDINVAIVHTYLKILASHPDTFIARNIGLKYTSNIVKAVKIGLKEAESISREAKEILELGGIMTKEGKNRLIEFDEKLKKRNLNLGTTADLTAASIFYSLLSGLRF